MSAEELRAKLREASMDNSWRLDELIESLIAIVCEQREALQDCDKRFQGTHEMVSVALAKTDEKLKAMGVEI